MFIAPPVERFESMAAAPWVNAEATGREGSHGLSSCCVLGGSGQGIWTLRTAAGSSPTGWGAPSLQSPMGQHAAAWHCHSGGSPGHSQEQIFWCARDFTGSNGDPTGTRGTSRHRQQLIEGFWGPLFWG